MYVLRNFYKYSLALIILLFISSLAPGATYYVAKSGNNSNSGTETWPWLTIQKAADEMHAGDIVYVKEGTYEENVIIKTSGTSFIAYTRHKAIIDGQIYFTTGSSYNKIDGFKNIGGKSINMESDNADHNIISNCILIGDGNGNGGGIAYSGVGNIFEGNEICYGGHGVHPGGSRAPDGTIIRNNIIHDLEGHGIAAVGGKNEKAIGNIIYNCRRSNTGGGVGIFFGTQTPENVWVEGNLVWGSERNEIWVEGPNGTVIFNTAVSTNRDVNETYCLPSSPMVVKNNIGYRTGVGKVVVLLSKSAVEDYNCWFNPDESKCISRYYEEMNLIQYQTYGQGLHSISRDPKFVDSANRDFHLRPDSPCIDAGDPASLPGYDLDGRLRPMDGDKDGRSIVDMGAYECSGLKARVRVVEVRNRPNPFRAGREETLIEYKLSEPSNVTITIYDLLGQEVWHRSYRAGENGGSPANSVPWDGRNLLGEVVGNGGYLCRVWVEREKRDMIGKIAVAK